MSNEPREAAHSQPAGFIPLETIAPAAPRLDAAAIEARLAGKRGRQYWRSLEELSNTEEFQRYLEREFPLQAPRDMAPLSRREFVRVMGATLALAGVGGCAYQPPEHIVPYVAQPEQLVPGKPLFFSTVFQRGGYACGLLGESHMGRPVKLEGNPNHPASLGATDSYAQGSLLGLYDPDRSQAVRHLGTPSGWEAFLAEMAVRQDALRRTRGRGLAILTGAFTSPTLANQLERFLKRFPEAKLYRHEPAGRQDLAPVFGRDVQPVYHLARRGQVLAERILSLDADFLSMEPGAVRYARDFSLGRRIREGRTDRLNRLYVAESSPSLTGACGDHTVRVRPSQVEAVARAVAGALGAASGGAAPEGVEPAWIQAVAEDLKSARGRSLVVAGAHQSPAVHALAHAMNEALGNVGQTVEYIAPVEPRFPGREGTLAELASALNDNQVNLLLVWGSNPVYTAPADLRFREAMEAAVGRRDGPLFVQLGLYDDETAALCHWHLPESHYLEAWSDARAFDGTASIVQPLITPLYATRSIHEVLSILLAEEQRTGFDIVREYWRKQLAGGDFEKRWYEALVSGVVPGTTSPAATVAARPAAAGEPPAPPAGAALEIIFRPDPTVWDGAYANNAWLQELPKPLSQLTWDNAVYLSPATARQLQLESQDRVELEYLDRRLPAAVWVLTGHPDGCATLTLGYGRARAGRIGTGTGFNAYALRTSDAPWFGTGLAIRKTPGKYPLASTVQHFPMLKQNQEAWDRHIVRAGTLAEFQENPKHPRFAHPEEHGAPAEAGDPSHEAPAGQPSLYPPVWPSDRQGVTEEDPVGTWPGTKIQERGYNNGPVPAWGMVIDLNTCIGCNACTIACQAENNIATVGKDQVLMNREMHWIRIDTYYSGTPESPEETVFQPVPCMHCEKAPCEPVCPVEATSHSAEGINEQTYNRCIGTRYCENNCPYKVRRFNYLQYSDMLTPSIRLMRNPDVTVRARGVMEKCTYCVQRVNQARMEAEKEYQARVAAGESLAPEDGRIPDGALLTACQQVCPTQAIVFGDANQRDSQVRRLKSGPLNYGLLTELNTLPRTSYLAKVWNPNPALPRPERGSGEEEHG